MSSRYEAMGTNARAFQRAHPQQTQTLSNSPAKLMPRAANKKTKHKKHKRVAHFALPPPPPRGHPTHLASRQRSHARVATSTPNSSFPRSFREVGDRQADLPQFFEGEIKLSDHFRRHLKKTGPSAPYAARERKVVTPGNTASTCTHLTNRCTANDVHALYRCHIVEAIEYRFGSTYLIHVPIADGGGGC